MGYSGDPREPSRVCMTQPRFDTGGVDIVDDPIPELPLALPGIVEPHAALARLVWRDGFPDRDTERIEANDVNDAVERADTDAVPTVAEPGASTRSHESDEFVALDLAETDHEMVEEAAAPPPAPAEAFDRSRSTRQRAAQSASRSGSAPAPRSASSSGRGQAVPERTAAEPAAVGPMRTPVPRSPSAARNPDAVDELVSEILSAEEKAREAPKPPAPWWSEVFDATYLRLLPNSFYQRTKRESAFLRDALDLTGGGRVLDLACGFGRHALELAAQGVQVVGVDSNRALLERALAEAEKRSVQSEFLMGDMRELGFDAEFDAAFCWNTSFGYFDDAQNVEVLAGMARALKPGGLIAVEQVNRDHVLRTCPRRLWWERDELIVMEDITFQHQQSTLRIDRSIMDDGEEPREQRIGIRLYAPHELRAMMRHVGLEFVSLTGDIAHPGLYVGPENRAVIVVARKPQ